MSGGASVTARPSRVGNLRNPNGRRMWDWAFLGPAFPGNGMAPMDVDGLFERHGYFLVLESKLPGDELSGGQERALQALARLPQFLVVVVEGVPPDMVASWRTLGTKHVRYGHGRGSLREFIARWYQYVDRLGRS